MTDAVSASIEAENTFTDEIATAGGRFDISISGVSDSTVTVQRRRPGATTWIDIEAFTASAERTGHVSGAWEIRAGVKTGEYGTDTVLVDLSK